MAEAKNVRRGRQRFCSRSCSGAATLPHPDQSGPNNRNWRGGVSTYRRDYADQARAHDAVRRAIKRGELTRQACERCASTDRVEAHHDDYGKPLDIRWLCDPCHKQEHPVARDEVGKFARSV